MRFRPGLLLKVCALLTVIFLFVIFLKDNGQTNGGEKYYTLSQKRQLKNDSKPNSQIAQTQKSPESLDLAGESDSLAGKRMDGLPNIPETR